MQRRVPEPAQRRTRDMSNCRQCGTPMQNKAKGRPPLYCSQRCKDKWRYYNSTKRKEHIEKTREQRRETGYHRERYANDIERQRQRSLAYYYDNRERILYEKRRMDIVTDACLVALSRIDAGTADRYDAAEWAEKGLGYKNDRIEDFIVSVLGEDGL